MSRSERRGRVQTVLGLIEAAELGPTLTHEHLLLDMRCWYVEPRLPEDRALAREPVSLENLGWVRYHYSSSLDNLQLLDETVATEEMRHYKRAGGSALVELTSLGIGRSPLGLARISRASGVHVVMGSGYYVTDLAETRGGATLAEDDIVDRIVREVEVGPRTRGSAPASSERLARSGHSVPRTECPCARRRAPSERPEPLLAFIRGEVPTRRLRSSTFLRRREPTPRGS